MKTVCELCKGVASIHCESDQATLCWNCDAKVHSANFLVARHSRNFLCHHCYVPTPRSASGAKLAPAIWFCEQCVDVSRHDKSGEEDEGVEAAEEGDDEEFETEDNHVVRWSPPPPTEDTSSSGGEN